MVAGAAGSSRSVEPGSFDEVTRKGGAFAALARAQFLVGEETSGAKVADAAVAAYTAAARDDDGEKKIVPPPNEIGEDAAE